MENLKFVFDLDGTIVFKGCPINEDVSAVLMDLMTAGHEVIFASASPIRDILPVLPKQFHGCRMVGGNGVFVYQNNEIDVTSFENSTINSILQIVTEYNLKYLIDGRWDYSFNGDESHPIFRNLDPLATAVNRPLADLDGIVKFVLFTRSKAIQAELEKLAVNIHIHGEEGILDISPKGIHKWAGLQRLGVTPGNFIAFGNDTNDISMFQQAFESICVGNHEIVCQFATSSTTEQQIAETIRQFATQYV